jgi:hypothetical protein
MQPDNLVLVGVRLLQRSRVEVAKPLAQTFAVCW